MHDPISALFAKQGTHSLASSALPGAPVLPDVPVRRRSGLFALRRARRRSSR
jgi:hypothetical protein